MMNKWQEMHDKGFFSIPMDPADLHKSEASGEIAMQETSDYEGVNLTDNFGGGNFDTFVMPTVSPDIKKTVFFEIAPICVAKTVPIKDLRWRFLRYGMARNIRPFLTRSQALIALPM